MEFQPESLLLTLGIKPQQVTERNLIRCEEATRLECVQTDADGREHWLIPPAAAAYHRMRVAAAEEGILFFIVSAFRSIERQADIVRRKLACGIAMEEALQMVAPPGYSEHHTGRAVDLAIAGSPPLEREFADTPAFHWLCRRAGQFGYRLSYPEGNPYGFAYEPWHWCWHP